MRLYSGYILGLTILLGCAGCSNQNPQAVTTPTAVQPLPSQSFIGDWLYTYPLSFQTQSEYNYYDIHATLYRRLTLTSDRTGTLAVRTTNETPTEFKHYCDVLVASGDTVGLQKVQIFFPMYLHTNVHWSKETDAGGQYLDVTTDNGHVTRYQWSLNDEGNLMTLIPTTGEDKDPEIYKRIDQ